MATGPRQHHLLDEAGFGQVLGVLRREGFSLEGPVARDGAIVLGAIAGLESLPRGLHDEQAPGRYRLARNGAALFGFAAPAGTWKSRFLPPRLDLVRIRRRGGLEVEDARPPVPKIAAIGVRPCDLAALRIQDRVLQGDADYCARRAASFVLAVNCTAPGGTCFCASMGSGPRAGEGADLAATELRGGRFLVEARSGAGERVLTQAGSRPATPADLEEGKSSLDAAAARMGRALDTAGLRERLLGALEDPRWEQIAARCLGCGNCTSACPTCFCTTLEDTTSLTGETALRTRTWDSCFTSDFAYVHGGSVRSSVRARYRQWLTHKLASWIDQFGERGCVGCGRCITWCPAAIDLTTEAQAMGRS